MKSRIGSTALVVFAIAGVIAGCSGGDNSAATTGTTTPSAPASTTPPATGAPPPKGGATASTAPADGAGLFAQNCAGCHGQNGENGKAPKLAGRKLAEADVATIVTNGKGKRMPAFGSRLSKDQIDAVAKYVSGL